MKKLLPILCFFFALFALATPVEAATVRGCEVSGPDYAYPDGTKGNAWVCDPGTTLGSGSSAATCTVGSGPTAPMSWSSTPPPLTGATPGCTPAVDFLSGGNAKSSPWVAPSVADTEDAINKAAATGSITAESVQFFQLQTWMNNWIIQMRGSSSTSQVGQAQTGAIQFFASSIGSMTDTRPASSIEYIAYMGRKLQVPGATTAYAATTGGFGYNSLSPVLEIWSAARNIAYLFFAVAFIIVGVQIMLGSKLKDQKTALSIQMALPKIIIALILVTFSYAIAGFVIDLMYVLIQLIFALVGPLIDDPVMLNDLKVAATSGNESIFQFAMHGWRPLAGSVFTFGSAIGAVTSDLVQGVVNVPVVGTVLGDGAGTVTGALASLVIVFAILYSLFKIWLKLVMAYVQIILSVIGAPLILMMDALPGSNNFANWFKTLLGNILMFPTVVLMIFLSFIVTSNFGKLGVTTDGFVPPLIGSAGGPNAIQVIIGMGILLTIPKILDQIPKIVGATDMFKELGDAWVAPSKWGYEKSGVKGGVEGAGDAINDMNPIRTMGESSKAIRDARKKQRIEEVAGNVVRKTDNLRGSALESRMLNWKSGFVKERPKDAINKVACSHCGFKVAINTLSAYSDPLTGAARYRCPNCGLDLGV